MGHFMRHVKRLVNDDGMLFSMRGMMDKQKDVGVTAFNIRRLQPVDADRVAHVLRISFDDRLPWLAGLHTPEEDRNFVTDHLFQTCALWGVEDGGIFGFIAFKPGWVEQLYILPDRQGRGAGRALLAVAKEASTKLDLWTFQRNMGARRFYEREGFVAIEETDGQGNAEREPDVLYRWQTNSSGT